ncbi:VCBS repeat-containing protein [Roseobacter sp.]|uniref:FG-GAP repeat domain-containing protein n=1 Tax=Roseobacter sp. TaxID=1907202 RepID=UPI0032991384
MHRAIRRALLAVCVLPAAVAAAPQIVAAQYEGPTLRYAHGVLGDTIEHTTLMVSLDDGAQVRFTLEDALVFEDTEPRVLDLDLDGRPEIVVVESSQTKGARLAVYNTDGRIAATPFIGVRFRWLAPVGAGDLDGDGAVEIAYIDRPHLAKTLRIVRFIDGDLVPVANMDGLTNHRIGERDIAGGLRMCAAVPEMILANADWSALVAVEFGADGVLARTIGQDTSRRAFERALECAD